jgi:hypothetical protein
MHFVQQHIPNYSIEIMLMVGGTLIIAGLAFAI